MKRVMPFALTALALAACDLPVPASNPAPQGGADTASPAVQAPSEPVTAPEPTPVSPGAAIEAPPPIATQDDSTAPGGDVAPTPAVAGRASIERTGVDSCGAADFAFLAGEPYAITYDIALPGNAVVVGRSQKLDSVNPNRMVVRVSTRSAGSAENTPDARILSVTCG